LYRWVSLVQNKGNVSGDLSHSQIGLLILHEDSTGGVFVSSAVFVRELVRITECASIDRYSNK